MEIVLLGWLVDPVRCVDDWLDDAFYLPVALHPDSLGRSTIREIHVSDLKHSQCFFFHIKKYSDKSN